MKKVLIVVEGAAEHAFFSKFLEICLNMWVLKKEESLIFRESKLLSSVVERSKFLRGQATEIMLIASYGNWRKFVDAYKTFEKEFENILYVADSEHENLLRKIPENNKVIIHKCFEDLFLKILENLGKTSEVERIYSEVKKLLKISKDKFEKKRKFSLAHALYGPKCWEHLFSNILKEKDFDFTKIEELSEIITKLALK